jgi:hypothetical protein
MPRTKIPPEDNGARYVGPEGNFTLTQQADLTWAWLADNHTFIIVDYDLIMEDEIPLPYYRVALETKITAGEYDTVSYVAPTPPPAIPDEYRVWYYVKEHVREFDKTTNPFFINYRDKGTMRERLHAKLWMVDGHVVQIIHYAEFDTDTQIASIPVIMERWYWVLDPNSHFVLERCIKPQGYRNLDDLADPENPIPVLLPLVEEDSSCKFYSAGAMQLNEIVRRRGNVVTKIKETVIGLLAALHTAGDIPAAIAEGQDYIRDVQDEIDLYISSGLDDLAILTESADVDMPRANHTWLDIDATPAGIPMTIYEYIALRIRANPSADLLAFDYDTLPDY